MGFKQDGFKVITPNKDVGFDLEGYTFTFDYKLPLNTWTKIKIKSDKRFTYLEWTANPTKRRTVSRD